MNSWNISFDDEGPVALREYDEKGRSLREVPEVITLLEICKRWGKSRRQLYRYIREGSLEPLGKFLGEWLFDGREVDRFVVRFNHVKSKGGFRLPSQMKLFIQEYDTASLHPVLDAELIISRILEWGSSKEIHWLFQRYPSSEIRSVLSQQGSRLLSVRSLAFWCWWFKMAVPKLPSWRRLGGP